MVSKAGRAPYGKRGDKQQRRREKAVIKLICEHAAKGYHGAWILDHLNGQSWTPSPSGKVGGWTRTTVERVADANVRIVKRLAKIEEIKNRPKVQTRFGCEETPPKVPSTNPLEMKWLAITKRDDETQEETVEYVDFTEEEWESFKSTAHAASVAYEEEKARREAIGQNWSRTSGVEWTNLFLQQYYGNLGLAGKDTWARGIAPLVVEQTILTGKPVLDLLDQIEGQPDVKGQLRRLWLGTLRELGMLRETVRNLQANKG